MASFTRSFADHALTRRVGSLQHPASHRLHAAIARLGKAIHRTRGMTRVTAQSKPLVALDFDGVVCDSCGESSLSAIKAAALVWPEIFDTPAAQARTPELVAKMRDVRPVVETGYENIVQVRLLYEGVSVQAILDDWDAVRSSAMDKWKLDRNELVHLFGQVRDDWMAADLKGWLASNAIYEGVAEPVKAAAGGAAHTYIVTTKQARFTESLMREMAGIPIPMDHIFSQTVSGAPKSEVLTQLQERHPDASAYIFVEDKLGTLEKVEKVEHLSKWELYLVDWGYNTEPERQRAAAHPRIRVIDKAQFARLVAG